MGAIKELLKAGIKALVKDEAKKPMATAKVAKTGKEELAIAKDSSGSTTAAKLQGELDDLITKKDRIAAKIRNQKGKSTEYSTGLYDELSKLDSMILDRRTSLKGIKPASKVAPSTGSKYGVGKDAANTNTNTGKPMATKLGVDEYMGKMRKNHERSETSNKERYEKMMEAGTKKPKTANDMKMSIYPKSRYDEDMK